MLKLWFNRELLSQQPDLARAKVANALWQKEVVKSESAVEKIITKLQILQNFISSSIPPSHVGDANQYAKSVKESFTLAIQNRDYERFAQLFNFLSLDELVLINNGERLGLQIPEYKLPTISAESVDLLQKYMSDARYSAAVSIMNAENRASYTVASEGINPQTPFAMHSVGKIFTGVLVLLAIRNGFLSENALKSPIQLASCVMEQLPNVVQKRLSQVTLKQIMLHESGLGDYLNKYSNTIREATSNNKALPDIRSCHDLLRFADDDVGLPQYSNLGILLVGLAIEHAYFLKTGHQEPYEEILRRFIINPVEMIVFSAHKPENGRYNINDAVSQYIVASPAGGYWTSVEDLQKFGNWVVQLCHNDPEFLRLLETYGGEFYFPEKKEIAHSGRMPFASAFLISSLESNTTVAILSDQKDVAAKLSLTIIEQCVLDNKNQRIRPSATDLQFFKKNKEQFQKDLHPDEDRWQRHYNKRFG